MFAKIVRLFKILIKILYDKSGTVDIDNISKIIKSEVKVGKTLFLVKSCFVGEKTFKDKMADLILRKI